MWVISLQTLSHLSLFTLKDIGTKTQRKKQVFEERNTLIYTEELILLIAHVLQLE